MAILSPHSVRPVSGFVAAASLRRRAADALRPPSPITVSAAAARHRIMRKPGGYAGPWRNETTPFAVEIMDLTTDRSVEEITLVAPSQVVKTEIGLNIIGHACKYRPADILVVQPTQNLAQEFTELRLDRMFEQSPDLRGELGPRRRDDKTFAKTFRRGMRVMIAWAVAGELASRPVGIVILDERDRMPNNLNEEGSPDDLARNRTKAAGRNGKIVKLSSPSKDDGTGILASYYEGDQNLLFWPCPECREYWSPGFDFDRKPTLAQLHLEPGASPDRARALVFMICPHCGCETTEAQKPGMLARSTWVPAGMSIDADGRLSGTRTSNRRRSYWLSGFVSPFFSWGQIAERLVTAEQYYERTGDEGRLKVVYNTDLGFPYKPMHGDAAPIEGHVLARRCEPAHPLGRVPNGVRFVTAAIDIQGSAFDVLVEGHNEHFESWVVDRFDIRQLADGRTDIRPARFPEHWQVLVERVLDRTYPFVDETRGSLPIAKVAIDSAGMPGVTDNAVTFYKSLRKRERRAILRQVMLTKGASDKGAPALRPPVGIELGRDGKRIKTGVPVYVIGVTELKNTLDNRLRRDKPGPLYKHFPATVPEGFFDELTAERRNDKGVWEREGKTPNETLDLTVGNMVAAMRCRPGKINWNHPPQWARPILAAAETPVAPAAQATEPEPARPAKPARKAAPDGRPEVNEHVLNQVQGFFLPASHAKRPR